MNRDEWLELGIKHGYIQEFCYTHDIIPMTDEESFNYYNDDEHDFCIPTLRFWNIETVNNRQTTLDI